ncbi:hypothetical protein BpHYR1_015694 [Brachionus plicatilis]|uniref:Uncharacterized protein n=1 Tax=Brachionus plicatilis TaxID=10195 RepID=A0A3M7RFJ3_BRAPC|nr:hypothetical protein BpHYR1_015694 [Brachionus plicatilis]
MSNFPGNNLSGIRAAYRQAPVMYSIAIKISQPKAPTLKALYEPNTKIPLRPSAMNIPARTARNCGVLNLSHNETTIQEIPKIPINTK